MNSGITLLKIRFYAVLLPLFFALLNAQTVEEKQWIVNGNNFYLQKEFDKARAEYSKVLAISPNNIKANYNLGNSYYELKDYKKAITHYSRVTQASSEKSDKAVAFHNMGNSFMQLQEYEKATEAYKNSLRNNPKDNETRYNFALAKKLLNQQQQKNQNPPDLPKPSAFALEQKAKADSLTADARFKDALQIMQMALKKDSTVVHFQSFIDKLNEVVILDTIKIK